MFAASDCDGSMAKAPSGCGGSCGGGGGCASGGGVVRRDEELKDEEDEEATPPAIRRVRIDSSVAVASLSMAT